MRDLIAADTIRSGSTCADLEAFKTYAQNARDNVKEISRIGVNSAKTLEQVSRETIATPTTTISP